LGGGVGPEDAVFDAERDPEDVEEAEGFEEFLIGIFFSGEDLDERGEMEPEGERRVGGMPGEGFPIEGGILQEGWRRICEEVGGGGETKRSIVEGDRGDGF